MAACTLGIMAWSQGPLGDTGARSMGLVTFSFAGIFWALEANDQTHSVLSLESLANRKLLQMSLVALVATIAVTEIRVLQAIFETQALTAAQWGICLLVGSVVFWIMEVVKLVGRSRM
jgi:Ca2+-transporting ATPase